MSTSNTTAAIAHQVATRGRSWGVVEALQALTRWVRRVAPVAAPATREEEARATREYALKFAKTDPRFAADLCAAADRHEIGQSV